MSCYEVNVVVLLLIFKSLKHLIAKDVKIVHIGSHRSSLSNTIYSDGNMSCRCSKAVLNIPNFLIGNLFQTKETEWGISIAMHPGRVQTETGVEL